MDKLKFLNALTVLWTQYHPNQPLAESVIESYWLILHDQMNDGEFSAACVRWARSSEQFMPRAGQLIHGADSDLRDRAREAWHKSCAMASTHGAANPPRPSKDLVLNATINRCGGWERFCNEPADQWAEKRFIETYVDISRSGERIEHPQIAARQRDILSISDVVKRLGARG